MSGRIEPEGGDSGSVLFLWGVSDVDEGHDTPPHLPPQRLDDVATLNAARRYLDAVHDLLDWSPPGMVPSRESVGNMRLRKDA